MTEKFQPSAYKQFTPRIERLEKERIASRSGIVFDRKWVWKTAYRNPIVAFKTLAISLLSLARRGVATIPDDVEFGFIHSIWTAGYYHWVTESLPRAIAMRECFPEAVPLLPEGRYRNYIPSLNCLGFDRVEFFPDNRNVRVASPVVTECAHSFGTTSPALLKDLRRRTREHLDLSDAARPYRLVYVSRAKARGRRLVNEEEVIEVMKSFGAEIICFEDLDFLDQVRLMGETRTLVSIHGAGLTNMVFMPEGGQVVEFIPRKHGIFDYNYVRNSTRHDPCYVRLAEAMGHEYRYLVTEPKVRSFEKTHMADVRMDPHILQRMLEELLQ